MKILKIFFISAFAFQLMSALILFSAPRITLAASSKPADITFTPQVGIGDFKGAIKIGPTTIGEYIIAIYKYSIGIVGMLAAVVIMYGGVRWITAGGSASGVTEAKEWIKAALTGLILTFCSYLILATVNTSLVEFKSIDNLKTIQATMDAKIKEAEYATSCEANGGVCRNSLPLASASTPNCPAGEQQNNTYSCPGWLEAGGTLRPQYCCLHISEKPKLAAGAVCNPAVSTGADDYWCDGPHGYECICDQATPKKCTCQVSAAIQANSNNYQWILNLQCAESGPAENNCAGIQKPATGGALVCCLKTQIKSLSDREQCLNQNLNPDNTPCHYYTGATDTIGSQGFCQNTQCMACLGALGGNPVCTDNKQCCTGKCSNGWTGWITGSPKKCVQ